MKVVIPGGSGQVGTILARLPPGDLGVRRRGMARSGHDRPLPARGPQHDLDSRRGVTVLFGGWDGTSALGDTWQWDGTAWSPLTRCYPDCDTSTGQRVLDIFDFLCFQNRFAAGTPYACGCDTSTGRDLCDIFDFLCFQNEFAAGCP